METMLTVPAPAPAPAPFLALLAPFPPLVLAATVTILRLLLLPFTVFSTARAAKGAAGAKLSRCLNIFAELLPPPLPAFLPLPLPVLVSIIVRSTTLLLLVMFLSGLRLTRTGDGEGFWVPPVVPAAVGAEGDFALDFRCPTLRAGLQS